MFDLLVIRSMAICINWSKFIQYIASHSFFVQKSMVLDGFMDGWVGGWMDGGVGLRFAYSNQKRRKNLNICGEIE